MGFPRKFVNVSLPTSNLSMQKPNTQSLAESVGHTDITNSTITEKNIHISNYTYNHEVQNMDLDYAHAFGHAGHASCGVAMICACISVCSLSHRFLTNSENLCNKTITFSKCCHTFYYKFATMPKLNLIFYYATVCHRVRVSRQNGAKVREFCP